jgi:hypothetical protein
LRAGLTMQVGRWVRNVAFATHARNEAGRASANTTIILYKYHAPYLPKGFVCRCLPTSSFSNTNIHRRPLARQQPPIQGSGLILCKYHAPYLSKGFVRRCLPTRSFSNTKIHRRPLQTHDFSRVLNTLFWEERKNKNKNKI